jgi:type VI protein secretion system component VasF
MSTAAIEDENDPTYTHFAHRQEFLRLLDRFLKLDLRGYVGQKEHEEEERLVDQLGNIVSGRRNDVPLDAASRHESDGAWMGRPNTRVA